MPEEFIPVGGIVSYEELKRRWPSVPDFQLAGLIKEKELPALWKRKMVRSDEGVVLCVCEPGARPWEQYDAGDTLYDWDNIVFRTEEVEHVETQHKDYTWHLVEDEKQSDQEVAEPEAEWISCNSLADRWGWSPFDVQALLYAGGLRFRRFFGQYGAPDVDELGDASVHKVDLHRWEAENVDKIRNAPVLAKDGERLREENKTLTGKVKELETHITALRSEIEALRTESAGPPRQLEDAKATNTRERWKGYMRTGLTLAVHVIGVGRKFTTKELEQECSRLGCPGLTEEAMQIFREAMPLECVHTGGRPKGKTSE